MPTNRRSQRFALAAIITIALIGAGALSVAPFAQAQGAGNPIAIENQNAGSTLWQYFQNGRQKADDATGQIAGYASATSVNKGGSISFKVSVNPAQNFTIDFFRMGWYGGTGGRLMQSVGPIAGVRQADCPSDAQTGLVQCNWNNSYTLNVPGTWTTGIYIAMLTNAAGFQQQVTFVVRDDSRTAEFLYHQPVLTYQAYNNWPAGTATGKSLYTFNSSGATVPASGSTRAVRVSFDRPGGIRYDPIGNFNGDGSLTGEVELIQWLEKEGYDVGYVTDIDTHTNGAQLLNYKGVLSAGHDEYWTKEMRNAWDAARDAGVNLAFFSSNSAYWQVRLEASATGAANRVVVGYKEAADPNPVFADKTARFRDLGRAEQALMGGMYVTNNSGDVYYPFIAQNTSHWIYQGSGLTDGAQVPGIVGYEIDRVFSEYAAPAALSYTLLGNSPFTGTISNERSQATIYQSTSGAWVFNSGTMSWSWGLNKAGTQNAGIQQMTRNLLARFQQRVPGSPTPTPGGPTAPPPGVCAFPSAGIVDNFNRADGSALTGWFGSTGSVAVTGNQLRVQTPGDVTIAWGANLGADQEAYVRLGTFAPTDTAIRLALKVVDGSFANSHLLVGYLPAQNRIQVLTFTPATGYAENGSFPVTMQAGDVLGARAASNGTITVYRNGQAVLSLNGSAWAGTTGGGFTGLYISSANNATIDDFGSGAITCGVVPTATPAPCAFPTVGILDSFNRADGSALTGWFGGTASVAVAGNQLRVQTPGDVTIAWGANLGADQEAFVKLGTFAPTDSAIRLALKVVDGSFGNSHLLVGYLPSQNRIQVLTFTPGTGYVENGSLPVTMVAGDVLGARAASTGIITVFRNGQAVLTLNASNWGGTSGGGYTGLYVSGANNATVDDFGSGSSTCGATPTPTPFVCTFPNVALSDNFDRPDNTSLFGPWFGGVTNFAVTGNRLRVVADGTLAWNANLGADQEAYVRLSSFSATNGGIRLALKVVDGNFGNSHILVGWLPAENRVNILTYVPGTGYIENGTLPITLAAGDVLGARALSNGTISVYRNGASILSVNASAFVGTAGGGFAGLYVNNAVNATLDDFGAGNVNCSGATATPTPTATPSLPTATATPSWIFCANENGTCTFTGTRQVRYGANGTYVVRTFTSSTPCTNAVFGDPVVGVVKTCEYSSAVVPPTPTNTPTATSTPTNTPTPVPPTVTPTPVSDFVVYGDALATNWQNWSRSGNVNLSNTSPVQSGTRSISFAATAPWAGLSLRAPAPVNMANYTGFSFWIYSTSGRALFAAAQTSDTGGQTSGVAFTPPINTWVKITVPKATLGNPASIARINITDNSGTTQPVFYVDDIRLTSGSIVPTNTPVATATPAWIFCANENGTCTFTGTRQVRYGANGVYAVRTVTGSTPCTNAVFGDPVPGVVKTCEYSSATVVPTSTPLPTSTPTRTPTPTLTPTPTAAPLDVTSFTLINADTDQPVAGFNPIPNNSTINLATLGIWRVNIRANVSGAVQSVKFGFAGNANYRIENTSPYAVFSDDGAGNYAPWEPTAGTYDLTGTAYAADNATGTASAARTVRFTLTYGSGASVGCSQASLSPASVTIRNDQAFPVHVNWKNTICTEVRFRSSLATGGTFTVNTFVGHVWVVRNASTNAIVKAFRVTAGGVVPVSATEAAAALGIAIAEPVGPDAPAQPDQPAALSNRVFLPFAARE